MKKTLIFSCMCLFCILLMSVHEANATESVFSIVSGVTAQDGTAQEITIYVLAQDEVQLEAFTIEVHFDKERYRLYTSNDELMQGYCYDSEFETAYEKSGMLVANAQLGSIVFSGMSAQEPESYRGAIAKVCLLYYGDSAPGEADVSLEVKALRTTREEQEALKEIPQTIPSHIEDMQSFEKNPLVLQYVTNAQKDLNAMSSSDTMEVPTGQLPDLDESETEQISEISPQVNVVSQVTVQSAESDGSYKKQKGMTVKHLVWLFAGMISMTILILYLLYMKKYKKKGVE